MMARILEQGGYQVTTAANGHEAVTELAKPDGPRLALVDWMMPELDGLGVCREVRKLREESYIYIVLLTSKESSEDVVQGLEAGADDYLTKPCDPAELKARLHTGRRILQLENKLVEARENMRFKATHDALTSLWDRGAIMSLLQSELSRSRRDGQPVSVILCDVDYFKFINDTHGHPAGDAVLEEISRRMLHSVRAHDSVGRYGGEEFLIVLGGVDREHLQLRAEQLQNAIRSTPCETVAGPLLVSISAGAITVGTCQRKIEVDQVLRMVDQSLYQAKEQGRNRIVYADPLAFEALLAEEAKSQP